MQKICKLVKKEITQENITDPVSLEKSFSQMLQQRQSPCVTQLESFESSMRYFVLFGNFFGLFPMLPTKQMKNYPVISWRYIFIIVTCVSHLAAAVLCFYGMVITSVNIGKFGRVMFYSKSCLCSILIMRLAAKWRYLMKQVAAADLNDYIDPSIKFKCNLATITFISLELLDFFVSEIAKFATIMDCAHYNSTVYEQYISISYNWFFGMGFSVSLSSGIFLHILTMVACLSLTYCQVLVISVSLYLSSILRQINKKIISLDCKYVASSYWRVLRQDYNRAIRLIHSFDDVINGVVLASFAGNLFYVCLQVFYVLRNDITIRHGTQLCPDNYNRGLLRGYDHIITKIYFAYSTIVVIIKSITVPLITARVHSRSLEIAPILYSIPPPTYCTEIQRFIDQVHGNTVALTGQKFFYVTNEVILSMLGTIITYELVLLQLD